MGNIIADPAKSFTRSQLSVLQVNIPVLTSGPGFDTLSHRHIRRQGQTHVCPDRGTCLPWCRASTGSATGLNTLSHSMEGPLFTLQM